MANNNCPKCNDWGGNWPNIPLYYGGPWPARTPGTGRDQGVCSRFSLSFSQEEKDMRRKAEVLQHRRNQTGLTKKQQWAYAVKHKSTIINPNCLPPHLKLSNNVLSCDPPPNPNSSPDLPYGCHMMLCKILTLPSPTRTIAHVDFPSLVNFRSLFQKNTLSSSAGYKLHSYPAISSLC